MNTVNAVKIEFEENNPLAPEIWTYKLNNEHRGKRVRIIRSLVGLLNLGTNEKTFYKYEIFHSMFMPERPPMYPSVGSIYVKRTKKSTFGNAERPKSNYKNNERYQILPDIIRFEDEGGQHYQMQKDEFLSYFTFNHEYDIPRKENLNEQRRLNERSMKQTNMRW